MNKRSHIANFKKPITDEHELTISVIVDGRAHPATLYFIVIGKSASRQGFLCAHPAVIDPICKRGSALIEMFGRRRRVFVSYQFGLNAVIHVTLPLLRFAKVPATDMMPAA